MPIRVLLVDQHEIVRAGTKLACCDHKDIAIVGEASSIEEGRKLALETAPDVLIVDPDCDPNGLDAIALLGREFTQAKIVVFTSNDGPDYASQIMMAGVSGYLIKTAGMDEIPVAIRLVHQGRVFISHTRHQQTQTPKLATAVKTVPIESNATHLSGRELEVLTLLADGMTNKQVAAQLYLSVKTIETYRSRIMKKYQLRDRADLVQFARRSVSSISA